MKVHFWGVRGSYPMPGPSTIRYGGNTSCVGVEVSPDGPYIILDAGTGMRSLGQELMNGVFGQGRGHAHLLISHTHWDHIQGLPFFSPLYHAGNRLIIHALRRDDSHLQSILAAQTDASYFPLPTDAIAAQLEFRELLEDSQFEIGPVKVSCTRLNHPWIAIAYRLRYGDIRLAYVTDTAPFRDVLIEQEFIAKPPQIGDPLLPSVARRLAAMRDGVVRLCESADLVIYDTQFTQEEYRQRLHWGHSCPEDALEIAHAAGAKAVALFHHSPDRSDADIDAIVRHLRPRAGALELFAASEGLTISLGSRR